MADNRIAALASEIKTSDAFAALEKAQQIAELTDAQLTTVQDKAEQFRTSNDPRDAAALVSAAELATAAGDEMRQAIQDILRSFSTFLERTETTADNSPEIQGIRQRLLSLETTQKALAEAAAETRRSVENFKETLEKSQGKRVEMHNPEDTGGA